MREKGGEGEEKKKIEREGKKGGGEKREEGGIFLCSLHYPKGAVCLHATQL